MSTRLKPEPSAPACKAPLNEARALDPVYYTDPDWYRFELDGMLTTSWQVIAPGALVSGPGDTIAREIGGKPVVVVRSGNGKLNGFYNICAHRAGPVATCDVRGNKRLRCAYHGWAYDLEGRLRTTPEMQGAKDFDRDRIGLTPIEVEEWGGMVWARAGRRRADDPSLSGVLAGIAELVDPARLASMRHHHSRVYDVAANWKVYADNYLEGYHLPFVHPALTQLVDYPDYKTELGGYWSVQRSAVQQDSGAYQAGEALYFFIHPNTMLNILPGRMQTNRIVAVDQHTCRVEFDYYYAQGVETRAAEDDAFSDAVQAEDRMICEHVQKGLTSGVYSPGRLSPSQEAGVWHWQSLLRDLYHASRQQDI